MELGSALPMNALFLLKVVPEVIDPVMGSFQLGCIKRQIRSIEVANICMMNLGCANQYRETR
jgi:hypothetical protein